MTKNKKSLALKNINFIQLLTDYAAKPKQFKKLIACATNEELNAISEVILNILKGNLPCGGDKSKIGKQANYLRYIANRTVPSNKRKIVLIKKGNGLIGPLLAVAIPAIIKLFSKK